MRALSPFCQLSEYDNEGDFHFHASIAIKLPPYKFNAIWDYLQKKQPIQKEQNLLRVTILDRNRKILREYDLIQGKMLSRYEALNRLVLLKTIAMLQGTKIEPAPEKSTELVSEPQGKVFFISDTHFDHANIIRYCKRPFHSVSQMNEALVRNWNNVISDNDTVYVLGDVGYGRGHRSIDYWFGKLKGKIMFVRGNHDKGPVRKAEEIPNGMLLTYHGNEFMLMHDPERPENWKGWIIHGDAHNNDLNNYPFINFEEIKHTVKKIRLNKSGKIIEKQIIAGKTINVSAEVINYTPVLLDEIIDIINSPTKVTRIKTTTSTKKSIFGSLMENLRRLFS
jgi:calcineurin-like phosphoesterase family protein